MLGRQMDSGREFLLVSDFDQTLSFKDSGLVLSEMLGVHGFAERVAGLANIHLVQQGGELSYLLLHDPEFRRVRKEHLMEVGKRIRLKPNIRLLIQLLANLGGCHFSFYVVSAAPEEIVKSALEGIVPADRIYGTQFRYASATGEIQSIVRVPAGHGKVAVLEQLRKRLSIAPDRVVYVGDGSSDVNVMLHVNQMGGMTIAVSENRHVTRIANRTVLGDDALSVLVPISEVVMGWNSHRIREMFAAQGFSVQEWAKVHTDSVTIAAAASYGAEKL